jgi:hypothetical protein
MTVNDILASIDEEISRLQQVRALLTGKPAKVHQPVATKKRRKLSAAARKRIADAQRKRWAAQKAKGK